MVPVLQLDIEEKVKLAKETEIKISGAREVYRPVATRGSLMYFLIDNINTLDRVYHYSMANFIFILRKGMDVTPGGPDQSKVPVAKRLEEEVRLILHAYICTSNIACPVVFMLEQLSDRCCERLFACISMQSLSNVTYMFRCRLSIE